MPSSPAQQHGRLQRAPSQHTCGPALQDSLTESRLATTAGTAALHPPRHAVHLQSVLHPGPACSPLPSREAVAVGVCQHEALQQLYGPAGVVTIAALGSQPQAQLHLCQAGLSHAGCNGIIESHRLLHVPAAVAVGTAKLQNKVCWHGSAISPARTCLCCCTSFHNLQLP